MITLPGTEMEIPRLKEIRQLKKADLHNHGLLGGKRSVVERFYGRSFSRFKSTGKGIVDLNNWIVKEYRPFFSLPGSIEKAIEAAFLQARSDGVVLLEMSVDGSFHRIFNVPPGKIIAALQYYHKTVAPGIDFRPEIGFSKGFPIDVLLSDFETMNEYGYFRAIDLYNEEDVQPVKNFKKLFQAARKSGLKCKAHAGEFGSAESVRETAEVLELDAIQHGIGAAGSPSVMRWLFDHNIQLNICPTSNIRLKRIRSIRHHPIRTLYDHGVRVTINTDDALIFGDGVSEQYLKLLRAGVFSFQEIDQIRRNGLED